MMKKRKFSKDPKTKIISLEEFYSETDFLCSISEKKIWNDMIVPKMDKTYYKFSPKYFICVKYGWTTTFYGSNNEPKLEEILVAYRDGKTEYELLENELSRIEKENIIQDEWKTRKIKKIKKYIPDYYEPIQVEAKSNQQFLVDTGYKTEIEKLKNRYLVIDVETNGLRTANDDLLSLSIYDPTTGFCYNRFFPLDLQPLILTSFLNGITEKNTEDATHMTQDEFNWLINYFQIKDRIILSFSGGKGTFDPLFITNYFKRHSITGFDNLRFENIKSRLPRTPYGCEGELTKDNLCRMFKIEGVEKIHTSYNDCILEWKLFEKLESGGFFFSNDRLFKYTPEYIIPCTVLLNYPELAEYANIKVPNVQGEANELFKIHCPKKLVHLIKKFPTNITGTTIEHCINRYLNAEEQNNDLFLTQNKWKLMYFGSLHSRIQDIPVTLEDNGTVEAVYPEDKEYTEEVNKVNKFIFEFIKPVADYLKENIFKEDRIMTQELSFSSDRKVLAKCDLSDSENVVEIKTSNIMIYDVMDRIAKQIFYQARGRNTYVLYVKFDTHHGKYPFMETVDNLDIILYKMYLYETEPEEMVKVLNVTETSLLREIIENPNISKRELSNRCNCDVWYIKKIITTLKNLGYIRKKNPNYKRSSWEVLRNIDDNKTKVFYVGRDCYAVDNKQV